MGVLGRWVAGGAVRTRTDRASRQQPRTDRREITRSRTRILQSSCVGQAACAHSSAVSDSAVQSLVRLMRTNSRLTG